MFANLKLITGNNLTAMDSFDTNKLFIINRWLSFNPKNSEIVSKVDRLMLGCKNKNLLANMMFLGCQKGYITKFLKPTKIDDEFQAYIREYYGLSKHEYEQQKCVIDHNSVALIKDMAEKLGWDKKTCKKYGVAFEPPKKTKLKKQEAKPKKTLWDF